MSLQRSRCVAGAGALLLSLAGCVGSSTTTTAIPSTATIVAQGQQAIAAAGGVMTTLASAACLAQSALNIAAPLAAATPVGVALTAAQIAAGAACAWTNPVTAAFEWRLWHYHFVHKA